MALTLRSISLCVGAAANSVLVRPLSAVFEEPELIAGLLAMGSMLFQQQRFNDALQLMQVAMDAGLDAPDLPEGQARAWCAWAVAAMQMQLLELLRQAEGRRRSGLEGVACLPPSSW